MRLEKKTTEKSKRTSGNSKIFTTMKVVEAKKNDIVTNNHLVQILHVKERGTFKLF